MRASVAIAAALALGFLAGLCPARRVSSARVTGAQGRGWQRGERVPLECKDTAGVWSARELVCAEDGLPFTLAYGEDGFMSCGVRVASRELYERLASVARQERVWQCRIPTLPVASAFLPLTFPLLGDTSGALAGDIHIDNHVAFVVHADAAR